MQKSRQPSTTMRGPSSQAASELPRRRTSTAFVWLTLTAFVGGHWACSPPSVEADERYAPVFATYHGGSGPESPRDVAVDGDGNAYITGGTWSSDLPVTHDLTCRTCGPISHGSDGPNDVYVTKFDSAGTWLWTTRIGGPNHDRAYAIEVDAAGGAYVGGRAGDGFPTTAGVLQESFGGDTSNSPSYGEQDAFVLRLNPDGSLAWATYFGGTGHEFFRDLAIDDNGDVHAIGGVRAGTCPHITAGSFLDTPPGGLDSVVAKISADGARVIWASYIGGSGDEHLEGSVRVDSSGEVYVSTSTNSTDIATTTGPSLAGVDDVYVAKLSADGSALRFATLFGGSGTEGTSAHNLAIDGSGNAYVAAWTNSSDLPVTAGVAQRSLGGRSDIFVIKVSPTGALLLATYVGGSDHDIVEGVMVDSSENVYIGGMTMSGDYPVTPSAHQATMRGGADGVFSKLSADFTQFLHATFYGGSNDRPWDDGGRCIAIAANGNVYLSGKTVADDWPVLNAHQSDLGGAMDGWLVSFQMAAPNYALREGLTGPLAGLRAQIGPVLSDGIARYQMFSALPFTDPQQILPTTDPNTLIFYGIETIAEPFTVIKDAGANSVQLIDIP